MCAAAGLAAAPGSAGGAVESYPGTYAGKGPGVKATVVVNDRLEGLVRYSMRSACGRVRGRIDLGRATNGRFEGKRVSAGPHRSLRRTIARITGGPDGVELAGVIRVAQTKTDSSEACSAKRKFKAELGQTEAFVPVRDAGHYSGFSADGLPIDFDVIREPGTGQARIARIDVDAAAYCTFDEFDPLEPKDERIVHLRGLEGSISSSGQITVEVVDEDNEFELYGRLGRGEATVELGLFGYFDDDLLPDPFAELYCENDGPSYHATLD